MKIKTYKRYTISTYVFKSLKEAETKIQQWEEEGTNDDKYKKNCGNVRKKLLHRA